MLCPYCHSKAKLVDSAVIYNGRSYGMIYLCSNYPRCDSYVGTHKQNNTPLGTMANAELRNWRREAHKIFNVLYTSGKMSRREAYEWLKQTMNLSVDQAHIAMMTTDQCKTLIDKVKKFLYKE